MHVSNHAKAVNVSKIINMPSLDRSVKILRNNSLYLNWSESTAVITKREKDVFHNGNELYRGVCNLDDEAT